MPEPTSQQTATQTNSGEQTTDQQTLQTPDPQAPPSTDPKPADQQTADQKTGDPEEPVGAPEKYEDFIAPEGQKFDSELISAFTETAKELNLSQKQAQTFLDKMGPTIEQRQITKLNEVREQWTETSKTDKEFGGDKLQENLGVAKAALDKYGSPELKDLLNQSGLGSHPEIIRFFYRAGKELSSDGFVGGHKPNGDKGPKTFNETASLLYPNQS
jgi:hypothetical protein